MIEIVDSSTDLGHEKSAGLSGHSFHGFQCLQTQPIDRGSRRWRKNSTNHPHYTEIKKSDQNI